MITKLGHRVRRPREVARCTTEAAATAAVSGLYDEFVVVPTPTMTIDTWYTLRVYLFALEHHWNPVKGRVVGDTVTEKTPA